MSLIGSLILSPAIGVGKVTDFDKATHLFYVLPPIGQGTWIHRDHFTVLWTGDIVSYRTKDGHEALGLITHLDFQDWEIEVMTEAGEYGYPESANVLCVVGRDMPTLTPVQQKTVNAGLFRLFLSKAVRLPALILGIES